MRLRQATARPPQDVGAGVIPYVMRLRQHDMAARTAACRAAGAQPQPRLRQATARPPQDVGAGVIPKEVA